MTVQMAKMEKMDHKVGIREPIRFATERSYYVEMTSKYFSKTSPPKFPSGFPSGRSFVCWSGKVL